MNFEQNNKSWVEPLREWVKTLNHAGKMANSTMDLSEFKSFSEKVGSNRLLRDKKIVFDWLPPFEFLATDKDFQTKTKKSSDKAELKKRGENKELLYWRRKRYYNSLNSTSA
ncbi:MAG: hypothetical protein ACYDEC_15655 [Bacteroidia bacterium]